MNDHPVKLGDVLAVQQLLREARMHRDLGNKHGMSIALLEILSIRGMSDTPANRALVFSEI